MYAYNPSPAETALLALISHRESGGDPTAQNPASSASGLYQFILATWQSFGQLAGVDLAQYPTAKSAPAAIQSTVALLLLREVGPNSSESWQASGTAEGRAYPTYQEAQLMLQSAGIQT